MYNRDEDNSGFASHALMWAVIGLGVLWGAACIAELFLG